MEFKYDPIDLEGPTIRLLLLRKGEGPNIQCDLFQTWLHPREMAISYEALSYRWGGTELSSSIQVDGERLRVTPNLYIALRHLRFRDKDRILWADAVCIDQANDRERGHQVQQMREVYKQASQVIFWLGEATHDINVLMDSLRLLQEGGIGHLHPNRRRDDKDWAFLQEEANRILWVRQHSHLGAQQLKGLQSLLSRDWFKRVWILQEVANAQAALVCCGTKSVLARVFALSPQLMGVKPSPHCQAVLDIMPGPSRKHSWWTQNRHLYTLLKNFRGSKAHDERDMIYALLGMSSDASDSNILRPDYETSVQELICHVIRFLYFYAIDPISNGLQLRTIEDLLLHLKALNSIALKKHIEAFNREKIAILLERMGTDITEDMIMSIVKNKAYKSEVMELILQYLSFETQESKTVVWKGIMTKLEPDQPLLHWAAQNGHDTIVKILLDTSTQLELEDNNGLTPLFWAVESGHVAIVILLLEKGAKPEVKDKNPQALLSWAMRQGHVAIVKLLLEVDIQLELESKDGYGLTPLLWAVQHGYIGIVEVLLTKGARVGPDSKDYSSQTPLSWAAKLGHATMVELILNKGAQLGLKDDNGQTPLSLAVQHGHEAVVELLLKKDIQLELELKDNYGQTPLSWAAEHGRDAMVELLLWNGAELESKSNYGQTPLLLAVRNGHVATVKLLVENGAQLELVDSFGHTPLTSAIQSGHMAVFKLLLDNGAQLESKNSYGQTSLVWAVEYRSMEAAKLLLEKGAQLESVDSNGRTALSLAAQGSRMMLVKLLLNKGAKLDSKDNNGWTPLSWAVRGGSRCKSTVELLLNKGAQPESKDKKS